MPSFALKPAYVLLVGNEGFNPKPYFAAGGWTGNMTVSVAQKASDVVFVTGNTVASDTLTLGLPNQAGAGLCLSYVEVLQ